MVLHEEMEVRLALRSRPAGEASNHPLLRWMKTVVVSEREKAHSDASGGDRGDGAQLPRVVRGSLLTRRNCEVTSKPDLGISGSG